MINPESPTINGEDEMTKQHQENFTHQCAHFEEDWDDKFPFSKMPELDITVFCDADHGHDLVTRRSITGILAFVGCTPVHWKSTRQTAVQTSTFGAEFMAMKKAVEAVMTLRCHLRSM